MAATSKSSPTLFLKSPLTPSNPATGTAAVWPSASLASPACARTKHPRILTRLKQRGNWSAAAPRRQRKRKTERLAPLHGWIRYTGLGLLRKRWRGLTFHGLRRYGRPMASLTIELPSVFRRDL